MGGKLNSIEQKIDTKKQYKISINKHNKELWVILDRGLNWIVHYHASNREDGFYKAVPTLTGPLNLKSKLVIKLRVFYQKT